ncbi:MAG: hypothetical protein K6T16_00915 [Candidatus Pacearchaeota archaeon]|nr:hypothetical protein [Candidatus Pacearchaeota archaeon]
MVQTKDELFQGIRQYNTDERKLEFIEKAMKKGMPTDVKIAAFVLRAEIHKNKKWFTIAARDYCSAADLAGTFREKMDLYFKAAVLFLHAEDYIAAEDNFRKVLVLSSKEQRPGIQEKINNLFVQKAEEYEKARFYTKAIRAYSKALALKLPTAKKMELYDKLAMLYEKIGKPRDANFIRQHKHSLAESEKERKEDLF